MIDCLPSQFGGFVIGGLLTSYLPDLMLDNTSRVSVESMESTESTMATSRTLSDDTILSASEQYVSKTQLMELMRSQTRVWKQSLDPRGLCGIRLGRSFSASCGGFRTPTLGVRRAFVSSFDVLRLVWADTAATIIQRHMRGRWGRRLGQQQKEKVMWLRKAIPAAVRIQKVWRGWKGRNKAQYLKMVKFHMDQRREAAIQMQASWRGWWDRMRCRVRRLTEALMRVRNVASQVIQRVFIGARTRRIVDKDYEFWVIKWNWDKQGAVVEVVGDFSDPPWVKRIPMKYCSTRECFVCTLPRLEGRYELKFIVNGSYICDGAETVISDGAGHYNNVVRIQAAPNEPPCKLYK